MAGALTKLSEKLERHGRGEGDGLPFDPTSFAGDVLETLPLDLVEPDPDQPRRDLGDIDGLAKSIREYGVLQPIVVDRAETGRFRILAGERRYTAAIKLGLSTIPAVVRSIAQHQRLRAQIAENVRRKDLDPFEEAKAYARLRDEFGYKQEQIAQEVGKSRVVINETLALSRLGDPIRDAYRRMSDTEKPSRSVLLQVAKLAPGKEQDDLWEQVQKGDFTVREARERRSSSRADASGVRPESAPPSVFHTSVATVTVRYKPGQDSDPAAALREALDQAEPPKRSRF